MSCPQRVGAIVTLQLINPGTQWSLVSAGIYQLPHQDAAGVLWRRHNRPTKEERAISRIRPPFVTAAIVTDPKGGQKSSTP